MKRLIAIIAVLAAAFGAVTWLVLESSGVAILRTQGADGAPRATHVWYAEHEESIWVEAATPEREFLLDVRRNPEVILAVGQGSSRYRAEVLDAPSAHERIRALLRQKYGLRDRWVGLLQDTSRSVALSLHPLGE